MDGANELRAPGNGRAVLLPLLGVLLVAIVVGVLVRHFEDGRRDSDSRTVLPFGN